MTATEAAPVPLSRKAHRTLEPLHVVAYFASQMQPAYRAAGARDVLQAYFGVRSAPMGRVGPEVVTAAFFNFAPDLVAAAIPAVWETTSPEALLAARLTGVDRVYRSVLGDATVESPDMAQAAQLAREATTALQPSGRALYAGHAALPWPEEPHLQLFHAQTLLREHRGDGHVAALTLAGFEPVEALVTHIATGDGMSEAMVRMTRGWSDAQWDDGVARARAHGHLDADGRLTDAGRARRAAVEAETDAAAVAAWRHLGPERTRQLRDVVRPWSRALAAHISTAAR